MFDIVQPEDEKKEEQIKRLIERYKRIKEALIKYIALYGWYRLVRPDDEYAIGSLIDIRIELMQYLNIINSALVEKDKYKHIYSERDMRFEIASSNSIKVTRKCADCGFAKDEYFDPNEIGVSGQVIM